MMPIPFRVQALYRRWHTHHLHPSLHWGALGAAALGTAVTFVILGWSGYDGLWSGGGNVPAAHAFFSGTTFEGRKARYINDQGRQWAPYGQDDSNLMRGVWAWLEGERQGIPDPGSGKPRRQLISDAVSYITGPGWYSGALPGANPTSHLYYQYYQDPATRESGGARALEVATIGVDYPSFGVFQNAMAGATLSGSLFTTSQGFTIASGFVDRDGARLSSVLKSGKGMWVGTTKRKSLVGITTSSD